MVDRLEVDKAPGPDGFTIKNFQKSWDLVKSNVDRLTHLFMGCSDETIKPHFYYSGTEGCGC